MGFFSRKKLRKRGAVESECRTEVDAKTMQSKDGCSSRELSGSSQPEQSSRTATSTRKNQQPAHARARECGHNDSVSPRSKSGITISLTKISIEAPAKHLPRPPPSPRKVTTERTTPPSILHQTTHFGVAAPTSPPPIFHTSPVPAYNTHAMSRVRFSTPSGGSVTSQSEASNVHMMAGSYASSSAMSSGMVMSEEARRLAAMGMGSADSKSSVGSYDPSSAMGVEVIGPRAIF